MKMKHVRLLISLSLLVAHSALAATPQEIQQLLDQSRPQAKLEMAKAHVKRLHMRHEIDFILLDLSQKEHAMQTNRRIEEISVVISAGLASYLGFVVFKPTASGSFGNRALMDLGERLIIGTVTSVGMVTSAGTGGLLAYRMSVTPEQMQTLRTQLLQTKALLEAAEKNP